MRGGGIQKLDSVHGHCDSVTHDHQGLNLNVGKTNCGPGNLDPDWGKRSKSGQTFLEVGKLLEMLFITFTCHNLSNCVSYSSYSAAILLIKHLSCCATSHAALPEELSPSITGMVL